MAVIVTRVVPESEALGAGLVMEVEGAPVEALEAIVMTKAPDPVPAEFVAPKVTLAVPAATGVPETSPVALLRVTPPGMPLALKLVGALDAVI